MSKKDNATSTWPTAPDEPTITVPHSLLRDIYKVLDGATAITETAMGKRMAYIRDRVEPVKATLFELLVK